MAFTGKLGSPDAEFGNFGLGRVPATAPPEPLEQSVLSTLNLTQVVARNATLSKSVSNTLALTQEGSLPKPKTPIVGYTGGQTRYVHVQDIDHSLKQELYALNQDTVFDYPASTTKLMTALLLMEYKGSVLDSESVTFNGSDVSLPGGISNGGFQDGDICTWRELLIAIIVQSAGDACQCAARYIGNLIYTDAGSTGNSGMTRFHERMNERAAELNMTGAFYYDSWGYSKSGGVTRNQMTAKSLTKLTTQIMIGHATVIGPIFSTPSYALNVTGTNPRTINFTNVNYFVNGPTKNPSGIKDQNIIGGKVGEWTAEGSHLNLSQVWVAPNGNRIVITTFNSESYYAMTLDQQGIIYAILKDWPYLLGTTPTPTDVNFTDVKLLIGADGSIVDESPDGRTVSNTGATVGSPTVAESSGAALFDAASDKLVIADTSDELQPGSGDFTVELWFAGNGSVPSNGFNEVILIGKHNHIANTKQYTVNYYMPGGQFGLYVSGDGTGWSSTVAYTLSTEERSIFFNGATRHIALTKEGSTWVVYINGERANNTVTVSSTQANNIPLQFGYNYGDAAAPGQYDDMRVTMGVARYTDNKVTITARKFSRHPPGGLDQVISNSISLSQAVARQATLSPRATNTLALTQSVGSVDTFNLTASNNLALTSKVQRVKELSANNTIAFGQNVKDSRPASNTLDLTHHVGLALIVGKTPSNTLNLNHQVTRATQINKTATSNLNLVQGLKRIRNLSASNTIAFGSSVAQTKGKPATTTFAPTQSVTVDHPYGRKLTQKVTFTQSVTETETRARDVVSSLALTHKPNLTFDKSVSATLVFNQNVNYILSKKTSNDLSLTQNVTEEHYKLRKVFANLDLTQVVNPDWVFDRSVSHNLSLTHQLKRTVEEDASNTLALSQSVTFVNSKNIIQSLNLTQSVTQVRIYGRHVIDTFAVNQDTPILKRVVNKRMLSILQLRHGGRILPIRLRDVSNDLALTQELHREVFAQTANDLLSLDHDVGVLRVKNFSVTHNLGLTQVLNRNITKNFSFTDTLQFFSSRTKDIRIGDLTQITIPNIIYSLTPVPPGQLPGYVTTTPTVRRQRDVMRLSVPGRVVVLPVPQFGDGEGNTDQFTMSYAIDGTIYTTVKKSGTRAINFEWDLSYPKAEELKEFVWDNNSRAIQIETWKGEIWIARMTTNPVAFTDQLRPELCESGSHIQVALEFEGVRIH